MEQTPSLADRPDTKKDSKFLKIWVRWEEPEDVGWSGTIGQDGVFKLMPRGVEEVNPNLHTLNLNLYLLHNLTPSP